MFERNRVDNSLQQQTSPAEITLLDGETIKGRFIFNASRSIVDVLNGESSFIEFETYGGDRRFLAKATLSSVKLISVPQQSSIRSKLGEGFDPHGILGVSAGASWDEIRAAYHGLSKTYHPDKFAGIDLPAEVREYLAAMARRINAAYTALEAPIQAAKRKEIERAKPIFTSQPQRV